MGQHYSHTKRKADVPNVRIMDRDVLVLKALLRFVVLDRTHLDALCGGGSAAFSKRLRRLYDAGYVVRPPIQNALSKGSGSLPKIYTLGQNGADFLREVHGLDVPFSNYERNANDRHGFIGQNKLEHDLGANGSVIALQNALASLDGVQVYTDKEIVEQSPEWTRKANKPFSIPTRYTWVDGNRHERNVIPDGVLGYLDTRLEKPVKALLFIEFDQKMDVNRSTATQSSIRQKIACYSAMFNEQTVKARFGFDAFRVLFVTTGNDRHLTTMVECCSEYRQQNASQVPPYPFFFSTHEAFKAADNPLIGCWVDGDGKERNITRLDS